MSNHRASVRLSYSYTLRLRLTRSEWIVAPNTNLSKIPALVRFANSPRLASLGVKTQARSLETALSACRGFAPDPNALSRAYSGARTAPTKQRREGARGALIFAEKLRVGGADPSALTSLRSVCTLWHYNIFPVFAPIMSDLPL